MVFVKEFKKFFYKLLALGWNLEGKEGYLTIGFSGINNSRYILLLDIK